jgi:Bacterial PH domain
MMEHNFPLIVRELVVLAITGGVVLSLWGDADKRREAKQLPTGEIEFVPNRRAFYAWPLLVSYLTYATVHWLKHLSGKPFNFLIAAGLATLTIMIATSFPSTIVVAADGLNQVSWLWENKRIRWEDIVEINTGEKSRAITITSADGTKIVHSRQLPDRARFLVEVKNHCGESLPADFPNEPITSP